MLRAGSIPKLYQPLDIPLSAATRSGLWLALSAYAIITLFGVIQHIPWRDEAFVWLLARELDYLSMWSELRYNGATALWHTMVFPLAKLGLPVASQNYLHWVLAIFTAWLFAFRAPFHPLLRAAFLVSYYMIFEHVIIARCYLPSLTLTFLICLVHKDRLAQPLRYAACIFLLANCNVFSLALAAVFGAFYALDVARARSYTLRRGIALLLILTGGLLAFFTLLPASDAMDYYRETFPLRNFWRLPEGISATFFIPHRYSYQIWVQNLSV